MCIASWICSGKLRPVPISVQVNATALKTAIRPTTSSVVWIQVGGCCCSSKKSMCSLLFLFLLNGKLDHAGISSVVVVVVVVGFLNGDKAMTTVLVVEIVVTPNIIISTISTIRVVSS